MSSITVSATTNSPWATTIVLILVAALAIRCAGPGASAPDFEPAPPLILWAWERPEDLAFLKNRPGVGVAFLAATLLLSGERVQARPRLQPLTVPEGTFLAAVARLETDSDNPPVFDSDLVQHTVQAILAETDREGVSTVQIDFDATLSERPFYASLLTSLRRQMSVGKRLSITALASWCSGDPWIEDLPVDEAVPMLFQMGPDSSTIERLLAAGRDFTPPVCGGSVGLSLDETRVWPFIKDRRAYLFNASAWTEQSASEAIQRWRSRKQ